MKKQAIITFLYLLSTFYCQAFNLDKNAWNDFEGTLGDKRIQLSIYVLDSGKLTGNYCNKATETKIQLIGQISGDTIVLHEFENGKPKGFFSGRMFVNDMDSIVGIWTDKDRSKTFAFKIRKESTCYSNFDKRYSDFYGTENDVENFMKQVKKSILTVDKIWIANHIKYPLTTNLNGKREITIKNNQQLIKYYDQIFYQSFKVDLKSFCACNMFTNYQGTMFGDGQIWIYNKPNSTEDNFDYDIISINNKK
jgi:hypothetical protein